MAYSKLGRNTAARKALLRNMVTSLLQHERIETTETKAKELRRVADQMITLGKRGDLHARRQALAFIMDEGIDPNCSAKLLKSTLTVKAVTHAC